MDRNRLSDRLSRTERIDGNFTTVSARRGGACWLVLLISSLLLPAGALRSQDQPQIKVEVKVVNVLATVRDKHGQIVSNLGKDDFAVEEDGRPQTITYFTRETDLPLTLGLLVDTSGSQRRVLDQERTASHSFIDNMLREGKDKAFVIHFDREVELLEDLTSSRQKLEARSTWLGAPQLVRSGGGGNGGGNGGSRQQYGGGGTLLYDAVYLASDEVMKKQQGRKAIIVLSDGVDHGSKETLVDAITTAQRADTIVYSILFADEEQFQNPFGGFGGPGMGRHGGGQRVSTGRARRWKERFSTGFRGKPAAACLRFPRNRRSTRFTPPSPRSCAISTALAIRRGRSRTRLSQDPSHRRSRKT